MKGSNEVPARDIYRKTKKGAAGSTRRTPCFQQQTGFDWRTLSARTRFSQGIALFGGCFPGRSFLFSLFLGFFLGLFLGLLFGLFLGLFLGFLFGRFLFSFFAAYFLASGLFSGHFLASSFFLSHSSHLLT